MNRVLRLTNDTQKADYSLNNQQELSALLTQYFPQNTNIYLPMRNNNPMAQLSGVHPSLVTPLHYHL